MSDIARDNILGRLRGPGRKTDSAVRVTTKLPLKQWAYEEKIERFTTLLTAVHAEVHRTTTAHWIAELCAMLAERSIRNLMYASETPIGQALDEAGESLPERFRYAESIEAFKPALFNDVAAALTGAHAGIAETGTLVLWPTIQEPRLMSLVPPVHIAVLAADRLFNTLSEIMTEENWASSLPTNALLISGPSKTADIEQTLAYGVHGPKELIVLLLEQSA